MLTPTMPPRPGARCEPRAAPAAWPSLLKPSRLITASSSGSRNMRGFGLPACGSGVTVPTSTKPKPSAEQRVRHLGVLVEAGRHADAGWGKCSPKAVDAPAAASSGSHVERRQRLQRARSSGHAPSRRRSGAAAAAPAAEGSAGAPRKAQITSSGNDVRAVRSRAAAASPRTRRRLERAVEMRKQCAAARRLPAQASASALRRTATSSRSAWPAKCLRRRLAHLLGGREVDVAVGEVDRRAGEAPAARPRATSPLGQIL